MTLLSSQAVKTNRQLVTNRLTHEHKLRYNFLRNCWEYYSFICGMTCWKWFQLTPEAARIVANWGVQIVESETVV